MSDSPTHTLVPLHEILNESEAESILLEYHIQKSSLPQIKITDASLPDGAVIGDVIRITRDARTIDHAIVHRVVIE
jgi:DNA-directed RNA polymerase subunit H